MIITTTIIIIITAIHRALGYMEELGYMLCPNYLDNDPMTYHNYYFTGNKNWLSKGHISLFKIRKIIRGSINSNPCCVTLKLMHRNMTSQINFVMKHFFLTFIFISSLHVHIFIACSNLYK